MNAGLPRSRGLGLVLCRDCHMLVRMPAAGAGEIPLCPRCRAKLHVRKPNSIARTWALVIASLIFYIPANVMPITVTYSLGSEQSDTIMSGVLYFIRTGSWGVAGVIFFASIFVPAMKLLVLSFLLVSVQSRACWRPKERTQLYRFTEAVGRWSMVDIYVVTILVALVKLGAFANVEAGPAALYFAAVVILTMLAAQTFDPRLIWDVVEEKQCPIRNPV